MQPSLRLHPTIVTSVAALVQLVPMSGRAEKPCETSFGDVTAVASADAIELSFTTTPRRDALVNVWVDDARAWAAPGAGPEPFHAGGAALAASRAHQITLRGLGSATPYQVRIDAGCSTTTVAVQTLSPRWPSGGACPEGDVSLPIASTAIDEWRYYTDDYGSAALDVAPRADAVELGFEFGTATCVVGRGPTFAPVDLRGESHLCVPVEGDPAGADAAVLVVLRGPDVVDPSAEASAWIRYEELADLPVRRPWFVDLREFEPLVGTLDLGAITGVDVGVACRVDDVWSPCSSGTRARLRVGDAIGFDAQDHVPAITGPHPVVYRPGLLAAIERDLVDRQATCGPLVENWDDRSSVLRFGYTNAMALTVLARGAGRTGEPGLIDRVRWFADTLSDLQAIDGGFCDFFVETGCGQVVAEHGCRRWIGSEAWIGIALLEARAVLDVGERTRWDPTIVALVERIAAELSWDGPPRSTEAGVSAFLFLHAASEIGLAAGHADALAELADALDARWDPRDGRLLVGPDDHRGAMDVTGGVGVAFWRVRGRPDRAATSLSFARGMFATRSFDGTVAGLGDMLGPWTINAEWGVGQYAAAGGPDAEYVVQQYLDALVREGRVPGSPDDFAADFLSFNVTSTGVVPAAWLYHAVAGEGFPLRGG